MVKNISAKMKNRKIEKIMGTKIKRTKFCSWCLKDISKGCKLCVKGRKLVLFATGLCSRNCYYCPLSEQKKNKDVIFANERPVHSDKEIIEEARISEARGASITGGDPLIVFERTLRYIKLLKKTFGRKFHIHLYAPTELVTEDKLEKLHKAGLDEIRFHPGLCNQKFWNKIDLALKFDWDVGIEIPAIPGLEQQTKKLIDYADEKVKFLNVNELEISDTNANNLLEKGFVPKDRISYGVMGSEELAIKLLKYCTAEKANFSVHYCTAKLKDKVQLGNRIKIRARNSAEKFDIITKEGMLLRGAIYLPETKPGFSYKRKIERIKTSRTADSLLIEKLQKTSEFIRKEYKIPKNLIKIDNKRLRIITALPIVQEIKNDLKKLNLLPAAIKQYPTFDELEVDIDFL